MPGLPEVLGKVGAMLADACYFNERNVQLCEAARSSRAFEPFAYSLSAQSVLETPAIALRTRKFNVSPTGC